MDYMAEYKKTILITGGTGTFGQAYTKHLLQQGVKVVVFSRNEYKQIEMKRELSEAEYILGDVRDAESICKASIGCDIIIHAAALKHVATGEDQPEEVIKTNIQGTVNVIRAAQQNGCDLVFISTDKAVEPINLYGATKMCAEQLVEKAGYKIVRYGNVFGSSGSILHIFKDAVACGHKFPITDTRMTRFIITLDEAMALIDRAIIGDRAYTIPKLKSLYITDLAKAFDPKAEFEEIGIKPGEKLAEKLTHEYSSDSAQKYTIEEIRGMIDAV
jgi:UDP-N-acetylglucosamine 4,6-dehydratase